MLNMSMLRPTVLFLLAGLLLVGLVAAPAVAQNPEQKIRAMMQERDRDIKQAVKPLIANPKGATEAQRQRAASLINDQIDFEEMGRRALGKYWADLTPAQRTEFVEVFGAIVRAQSLADLDIYNASVTYDVVKVIEDSAYVRTAASFKGKQAKVEYYLGLEEGTWWLYDIVLDEVSTVEGYAKSFQTAIRKRGFDGLMKSLNKKYAAIQQRS